MLKILLLNDSLDQTDLTMSLVQKGHIVAVAPTLQNAWDKLSQFDFDWILCHRCERDGLIDAFLEGLAEPECEQYLCRMLILTPSPAPENTEALPVSQVEILKQPFDTKRVLAILESPVQVGPAGRTAPASEPEDFNGGYTIAPGVQPFIGDCPSVQNVIRQVEKVASVDATVLLLGESGTGKELIAQSLHYSSKRSKKALIPINCGAIPQELLESELFGHVKGAFSGATAARPGRFALADGGTLFLDEVGELALNLQVKLLRALQEGEITPLGASKTQKVDVRIVAATNQNLEELVEKKLFREDLYYRLNVIPILLPPLRERLQDIPQLISFFLHMFNEKVGSNLQGFSQDAMQAILDYPWPGNIRELKNFVERLAILNDGDTVTLQDLPEKIKRQHNELRSPIDVTLPDQGLKFYDAVEQFEKALIVQALDRTDWNKNKAAALLAMNRTTLVEKIKKKEISRS